MSQTRWFSVLEKWTKMAYVLWKTFCNLWRMITSSISMPILLRRRVRESEIGYFVLMSTWRLFGNTRCSQNVSVVLDSLCLWCFQGQDKSAIQRTAHANVSVLTSDHNANALRAFSFASDKIEIVFAAQHDSGQQGIWTISQFRLVDVFFFFYFRRINVGIGSSKIWEKPVLFFHCVLREEPLQIWTSQGIFWESGNDRITRASVLTVNFIFSAAHFLLDPPASGTTASILVRSKFEIILSWRSHCCWPLTRRSFLFWPDLKVNWCVTFWVGSHMDSSQISDVTDV